MKFIRPQYLSLRNHPEINEKVIQQAIVDDPGVLGIGVDLHVKDTERRQARAGRLDLLLVDSDVDPPTRYEVEIQLGPTDESHIIRTIEYWDLEKKRYPQYDHVAVIVAEEITARFLNVIALFNGFIPIIALQLRALQTSDGISLVFTKVMDQLSLGLVDEDEEVNEPTTRSYWESKASKETLSIADKLLEFIRKEAPTYDFKYNKAYIGMAKNGVADNFVAMKPKQNFLVVEPRLDKSDEIDQKLSEAGLEPEYKPKWGRYKLRLVPKHSERQLQVIVDLLRQAVRESEG